VKSTIEIRQTENGYVVTLRQLSYSGGSLAGLSQCLNETEHIAPDLEAIHKLIDQLIWKK